MNLNEVTGLGRHLDLSLRSNRIVVMVAGAVGASALGLTWLMGNPDLLLSVLVAVGAFLAWAVARELDPDNQRTATRATIIASSLALFGLPSLIAVAVVLLTVRILAGTVGAPLRTADLLVLVGTAGVAGSQPLAWPAAVALMYAVWTQKPERYRLAIGTMAFVGLTVAVSSGATPSPGLPGIAGSMMLVAVLVAGSLRARAGTVRSVTDRGDDVVDPARVSLARRGALFSVVGGSLLMAPEAIGLAPVMAAILSVAITRQTVLSEWPGAARPSQQLTPMAPPLPAKPHAHSAGSIPAVL